MMVLPSRAIRTAPAGAATSPLRPTRAMVPASISSAPFSIVPLASPGIMRAPSSRIVWADAGCMESARTNKPNQAMTLRDMDDPFRCAGTDAGFEMCAGPCGLSKRAPPRACDVDAAALIQKLQFAGSCVLLAPRLKAISEWGKSHRPIRRAWTIKRRRSAGSGVIGVTEESHAAMANGWDFGTGGGSGDAAGWGECPAEIHEGSACRHLDASAR